MLKTRILTALTLASFILSSQTLPEMRMLPHEIPRGSVDGNQIGSSRLAGVHTTVLVGDPAKPGF